MLKKFALLLLLAMSSCFSQSIVWETEFKLEEPKNCAMCNVLMDSKNNFICSISDILTPINTLDLFKISSDGKLLRHKELSKQHLIMPLNLQETNNGYNVFCGTSNQFISTLEPMIPMIESIDQDFNVVESVYPYNINNKDNYNKYEFYVDSKSDYIKEKNGDITFCFDKDFVMLDSNTKLIKSNIQISRYRSDGRFTLRRILDTLDKIPNEPDRFYVCDLINTNNNTFILLAFKYRRINGGYLKPSIYLTEVDSNYNLIYKNEYAGTEVDIVPEELTQLNNSDLILLGHYFNIDNNPDYSTEFLWKLSQNGKVLQKINVPKRNQYLNIKKLFPSIDGGFFGTGMTKISDNKFKIFIIKFNTDLKEEWYYEWHEYGSLEETDISDVFELNNKEYVVIGNSNSYNFYIAKVNKNNTDVKKINPAPSIVVKPNPVTNVMEISLSLTDNGYYAINIFDILGKKVKTVFEGSIFSLTKNFLIDSRELSPGTYYVIIEHGSFRRSVPVVVAR